MQHNQISKEDLIALAIQYRDDMRHPPSAESRKRRLDWIETVIGSGTSEVECSHCEDGKQYQSKYGGNDPDVWPVTCAHCGGSNVVTVDTDEAALVAASAEDRKEL